MAVVKPSEEATTQMNMEGQPDGPGPVGAAAKPDDASTGAEADNLSRRRGRRRDGARSRNDAKRSRSPEIWTRRGRGRADRLDMVCV